MNRVIVITSVLIFVKLILIILVIASIIIVNMRKLNCEMNKLRTVIGMVPYAALTSNEHIKKMFLKADFLK